LTDKAAKDITSLLDSERELWLDAFIMELTQPITDEEILVAALRILAALAYDGTVGCFFKREHKFNSPSAEGAQAEVLVLIPTLLKHLKQHDFYVSPPVGNVICAHAIYGSSLCYSCPTDELTARYRELPSAFTRP
jgi:hypothetical protein